eukprot:GAHX01000507.1.p1 GENE.GAHX01000507.1~~GAHX01000507.1.p1  ORF type:complete len:338 (-),score=57.53 GAHX01000507.1:29-1042(-)
MNNREIIRTNLAILGIIALLSITTILLINNFSSDTMFSHSNPEIFFPLELFPTQTLQILTSLFLPFYILLTLGITSLLTNNVWHDLHHSKVPSFTNLFFIHKVTDNSKKYSNTNYTLLLKNALFLAFTLSVTFIVVDILNIFVPTPTPNFISICNDKIKYEHNMIGKLSSSEDSCIIKKDNMYDLSTAKKGRMSYNAALISILVVYYFLHIQRFVKLENYCRKLKKEKKTLKTNNDKEKENKDRSSEEEKTDINNELVNVKKKGWDQYNIEYNSSMFLRPFINLLMVTFPLVILLIEIAMYKYSFISEIMGAFIGALFGITILKGLRLNEEFDGMDK